MADEELEQKMRSVHWVPLESNPEMLTQFSRKVGLPEPWEFVDIFGVDDELLAMVPPGSVAVTLLFQCSENLRKFQEAQRDAILTSGQVLSSDIFYLKQYVGNACGTIASIHCLANNAQALGLSPESPLGRFLSRARGMTPQDAGRLLADANELHEASEASAQGGQTQAPEATEATDHHFISFVEKDGMLYELDGTKAFPINHGPTGGHLLRAAANIIKEYFMERDPENIQFNMMALVRNSD